MKPKRDKSLITTAQRVKNKLEQEGYTLLSIDREFNLPRGTAGTTLREPNQRGEEAIAAALGVQPVSLWPLRYEADTGHRLSPQPSQNYERPLTILQRRKLAGART